MSKTRNLKQQDNAITTDTGCEENFKANSMSFGFYIIFK